MDTEQTQTTEVINRHQFPCPYPNKPKYETAEALANKVAEYFQICVDTVYPDNKCKPPTLAGLALHLGFESRQSIYDYEKKLRGKNQFSYVIKRARSAIEDWVESGMLMGKVPAIPGIFTLKNNHGWVDKQEIEVNTPSYEEIEGESGEVAQRRKELQTMLLKAKE
jgi:hypothetical protein